jgi:hypothetical protein
LHCRHHKLLGFQPLPYNWPKVKLQHLIMLYVTFHNDVLKIKPNVIIFKMLLKLMLNLYDKTSRMILTASAICYNLVTNLTLKNSCSHIIWDSIFIFEYTSRTHVLVIVIIKRLKISSPKESSLKFPNQFY